MGERQPPAHLTRGVSGAMPDGSVVGEEDYEA